MFRIGEFSKLTQVSIRMLRYYDEVGLLKPAQIDPVTGYRSYSGEQIPALQKIIMLRDLGYSVMEIFNAMNNWSDDFLSSCLRDKRLEVEQEMALVRERLMRIDSALSNLSEGNLARQYNFILKEIPSYPVISLRRRIPDYFQEGMLWKELSAFVEREKVGILPNADNFAIYHDEEFKEEDVDVEVCVVIDDTEMKKVEPREAKSHLSSGVKRDDISYQWTEKVEFMACAMVYGPFENIRHGYLSFSQWLSAHPLYRMEGENRQICHRGPWKEAHQEDYLTEIQIRLAKKQ